MQKQCLHRNDSSLMVPKMFSVHFFTVFFFFLTVQSHHYQPEISSVSLSFLCLAQNFLCLPPLASRLANLRSTAPSLLVQRAKNTCHVGLLRTDWQQSIERGGVREAKRSFSVRYEAAKMYGSKSPFSFVRFCFFLRIIAQHYCWYAFNKAAGLKWSCVDCLCIGHCKKNNLTFKFLFITVTENKYSSLSIPS